MPSPKLRPHLWRYTFNAYRALPITFLRRVVLGRDPYWRQYFWSRWGYFPKEVREAVRGRRVLWIDALSGGEVTQIVTFCRKLRDALPDWVLMLSTNSHYSYEFARTNLCVDFVIDTPWDCRGPVKRALDRVGPAALVCVENVTCPVLLQEAKRRGVTTILVSGLMSKDIHLHPMLHRTMEESPFGDLDWIGAKSQEDTQGFIDQGARPERVVVTGNMKFDPEYLEVPEEMRARMRTELRLAPQEPVLLAASLHPGEEELVGKAYIEARLAIPGLRLVLVPRYQFYVDEMIEKLRALGLSCVRKTSLAGQWVDREKVIVVDTFGELSRLYAIASAVFLGGSMYRRNVLGLGQNIIEPLIQRVPIFFGPFMNLWRDITNELKSEWPGVEVTTSDELRKGLCEVLNSNSGCADRIRRRVDAIIWEHRNDVVQNVKMITEVLSSIPQ